FGKHADALQEEANPSTFAAVLPSAFVALVPRDGDGHLETIEELAKQAKSEMGNRWKTLAGTVLEWFKRIKGKDWDSYCEGIWERQHRQPPIYCTWVAVPWLHMGGIESAENLRSRALPAQHADFRKPAATDQAKAHADHAVIDARRKRLAPWVPKEVWGHYELAREVFARSRLDYHQMERGFDYALTHHQLGARHALRKATDPAPNQAEEPGEKCTLCGQREALRNGGDSEQRLDSVRQRARQFWSHKDLDPDETGSERLCAVCAMKRLLVKADQEKESKTIGSFNKLWAGMDVDFEEIRDRDGEVLVPFPSTSTIAAQEFIDDLITDGRFENEITAVACACKAVGLQRTSFPRALPKLAPLHRASSDTIKEFLEYEAQDVVFPETSDGKAQGLRAKGKVADADNLDGLKMAVQALRKRVKESDEPINPPKTRIAVIRLDGDRMGRL
ncbi:MAG: hypothetical protein ACREXY_16860, partial [Gammaproteobacteria bacterium]